jgi:4-amino-4-deoxy-L-arabinose transferase-like glycosyltransferase
LQPSTLAKRAWFLLFIAIGAIYLFGLGKIPLVGPDEPRYAEVAREMLSRHDFITPTLAGMPWFEKPPLLYWMIMASYRVFGVNEFATRLGPAICGLLTGLFVYWLGSAVRNYSFVEEGPEEKHESSRPVPLGRWSALALLSSVGIIAFSRAASFDIVLTMTLSGALACFFVWHLRCETAPAGERAAPVMDSRRPINPVVLLFTFYFFIGLSLLAKGLIGIVLPFGILALYFLFRRERPQGPLLNSLVWGIPIAAATAMVWYGPMIGRHGWTSITSPAFSRTSITIASPSSITSLRWRGWFSPG